MSKAIDSNRPLPWLSATVLIMDTLLHTPHWGIRLRYNRLMMSEFQLIEHYFRREPRAAGPVRLGVGDDCALLKVPEGETLAISTDMLVEGRHFFAGADPFALGHKTLAVNLSDLAAMGARPLGFTLALSLPAADADWLRAFSTGLLGLADTHQIELIGGDTTRGPLNLCVTAFGSVPEGEALRRKGACPGDEIWVSGTLGDAKLALSMLLGDIALEADLLTVAAKRLHTPTPRTALGIALRGIASAAIDISDGLSGDLGHILAQSGAGAIVNADALPLGQALSRRALREKREFAASGGDDYELCFCAPAQMHSAVLEAGRRSQTTVTCIGRISAEPGLQWLDDTGQALTLFCRSFDHFAS